MWLFIKSLFMLKDRTIAKEMVSHYRFNSKPVGFKLARLMRRRARRNKFKAHNTTHLKYKVK
ncbi:hypothetical protein [Marinicella litoralis]|uniref:Uncharacterized protein n=1 Tax=Marinicella litoralis TaxID=644220 RepID=A0A4R6XAK5_9GAMM|nr:hypothetical protein [Marinicella litoralis]TDR14660.1 hypothetical protein C8D91_2931 [Marinicella litoralis]